MSTLTHVLPVASKAHPVSAIPAGVFSGVFVTSATRRPRAETSGGTDSPNDICASSDRFEMSRVHTSRSSAQMVENEPIGNRTDAQCIRDAMSILIPPLPMEASIACCSFPSNPQPALLGMASLNLSPEAFLCGNQVESTEAFHPLAVQLAVTVARVLPRAALGRTLPGRGATESIGTSPAPQGSFVVGMSARQHPSIVHLTQAECAARGQ